jgi:ribonuclease HI
MEREDTYHTFCRCLLAKKLWEAMREVWPLKPIEAISNTGTGWLLHTLQQATEQERLMMLMTFWRIWHVRNEVVHQKAAPPVEASRRFLCSYVDTLLMIKQRPGADPVKGKATVTYDHIQKGEKRHSAVPKPSMEVKRWSKPPLGWVKLNVDSSWYEQERQGGTGMILRDDEGSIMATACSFLKTCASPLEAEMLACHEGMRIAREWTDKPIVVESDCQVLVSMLKEEGVNRSPVATVVNQIKRLEHGRPAFQFSHISRDLNVVSHTLARFGCTNQCTKVWIRHGPVIIRDACNEDKTPMP